MDLKKYILDNFHYNPETGIITRSDRKNSTGSIDHYGYLILKIKGEQFKAHRVAWFLYYGTFPDFCIDHINGNKLDNRILNLRDVTIEINNRNARHKKNKDTGVRGIYYDKCTKGLLSKYSFSYNTRKYRFRTLEEAILKKEELNCNKPIGEN